MADLADLSVDEIMTRWPSTIGVFVEFRMKCVGCPVGRFHSLTEAATDHAVAIETVSAALEAAISENRARGGPVVRRQR